MLNLLFCIALTVPTVFSAPDKSLVEKAKSMVPDEKLKAVIEIHRMLEEGLENDAVMPLIDDFITAGLSGPLVDSLSKGSHPQLVANAMAALSIIAPQKAEPILEAQNVMVYLNYWLMNSTDEEVKEKAAYILENLMDNLFIKVEGSDQDEKLEAVTTIQRILKECRKDYYALMPMINELIEADILGPLVECLSKDNASNPQLVAKAMAAVAIIAAVEKEHIFEIQNVMDYLNYWLMNTTDEQVKKNAAPILKNIMDKLFIKVKGSDQDEKLEAVTKIHSILNEYKKDYHALLPMVNKMIEAGILGPLVECLSKGNVFNPQLVANAMAALAIISTVKKEHIFGIQKVMDYLKYWLMNTMDEEVKKNAASILKNIMDKLFIKVEGSDQDEKLEAVKIIHEMLDVTLKGNLDEQLINELISDHSLGRLVDCLSEENASHPKLVANAMAALAIIAPLIATEIHEATSAVSYLEHWIKHSTTDEELLKNALSILKNILAKECVPDMNYELLSIFFNSRNKEVFEEAMCAAYQMIKRNGHIYKDTTTATHIQSMIEICDDTKTFCGFIEKNADDKITSKILLAMKSIILNPKHQNAEVVKKVEDCWGTIEELASDKSIAKQIVSLLQIRDEIRHLKMDMTNTSSLEDVADPETKKDLQTVMLPLQYPDRFQGLLSPQKSILLDGAQGRGKEMLAKAAAKEWSAQLFSIPSSVILSKKDKKSVDFIKMLFQMATNAQPSIIFIGEIDQFLRSGTGQRGKAQFFIEMDRLSSNSVYRVLVIGATDRPKEMDEDAIKRFAKRIFVENPSQQKREKMIRKIIEENQNSFELRDEEIEQLASKTENFSFDDLLVLFQTVNLGVLHIASEENEMDAQLHRIKMMDLANAIEKVKPKLEKAENEQQKLGKLLNQKSKIKQTSEKEDESSSSTEDLENAIEKPKREKAQNEQQKLEKLPNLKPKGKQTNGRANESSANAEDFENAIEKPKLEKAENEQQKLGKLLNQKPKGKQTNGRANESSPNAEDFENAIEKPKLEKDLKKQPKSKNNKRNGKEEDESQTE
ncbi:hypothetical protein niasHS_016469 [Heterodera schachtii]|uniref:AAA+ ATPase domain-containing protein n=1 Tax=Heterodera schachtii TaxID=97005 RepID=A0ABD2HRS3_HETSC